METLTGIEKTKAGEALQTLSSDLQKISLDGDKTATLQAFLDTLNNDISAISAVTGESAEGVQEWLQNVSAAAATLDPADANAWDTLIKAISEGLPGLEDTEGGKSIFEALGAGAADIGKESGTAAAYLEALGIKTDSIADKNALWLETCKRLIQTIPGLASIINAETGEVTGGIQAVKDYVQAWEEGQTKLAMMGALEQKENAVASRFSDLPGLELDMAVARHRVRKMQEQLAQEFGAQFSGMLYTGGAPTAQVDDFGNVLNQDEIDKWNKAYAEYSKLVDAEKEATSAYKLQAEALDEAQASLDEYRQTIAELPGDVDAAASATEAWTTKSTEEIAGLVTAAQTALDEMKTYHDTVRAATEATIASTIKGFQAMESPVQSVRDKVSDLNVQLQQATREFGADSDQVKDLKAQIAELNKQDISASNMAAGLESQLDFMDRYLKALEEARNKGLSDDLLASLSDGSYESLLYLEALSRDTTGMAAQIDEKYKQVQEKKSQFTDALTDQKLAADEMYQGLVDKAAEAVAALDLNGEAAANSGSTVEGIAAGIREHVPSVAEAVDAVLAELDRLNQAGGWGLSFDMGPFGSFALNINGGKVVDGSHETGLNYVPFDGYLAQLHAGEGILTAEENRIWQRFKGGDSSVRNVDYDTLGGVMRDNVHAGGNVYLDGRTVGKVIDDQQATSYRSLKRSGWQA